MTDRVILAVKYTPAGAAGAVRKAVGGFLRYVQYRDKHVDSERAPEPDVKVSGLLKYVAYRDRTGPRGRLFGPSGPAGDMERRALAELVARAVRSTRPQPLTAPDGSVRDARRAVYRMVISPEHAAGLELRDLTRAAMQQLAADVRTSSLDWVAAEHRNTAHPHVHVVLAGFVDLGDGRYRGLALTRTRLQRMKEALGSDLARQRGLASAPPERPRQVRASAPRKSPIERPNTERPWTAPKVALTSRRRRAGERSGLVSVEAALRRAADRYRRELEAEERQAERQRECER